MQDSDNMFVFFKPSTELAEEIIKQNQALVKEYAARTAPEETAEYDEDESSLGQFGLNYQRPVSRSVRSPIETGQQVITERIYHYLSSLSESPWAMEGGSFAVSEYLSKGLITMLGFSSIRKQPDSQRTATIERLVERLTEEFVDWLANQQNGAFVTPWLEIHLSNEGELRLISIPETEVEDESTMQIANEASASSGEVATGRGALTGSANVPHLREIARELDAALVALRILGGEVEESSDAAEADYSQRSYAVGENRIEENVR